MADLPIHTLHKLKFLDVNRFGSFKLEFNSLLALRTMRKKQAELNDIFNICQVLWDSYNHWINTQNTISEFRITVV